MSKLRAAAEVLAAFLKLGLGAFGGPVAHLSYFRREFVEKRGWLSAEEYGGIVAMCQFLPGPASSQAGFCIGLKRAGWLGGLAAFAGFTLPSVLLMILVAHWARQFQNLPIARGALAGLQIAAVAVVAHAVWSMVRNLCPDTPRQALALLAAAILILLPNTGGQLLVLLLGAAIGRLALEAPSARLMPMPPLSPLRHRRAGTACLAVFLALLALAFWAPHTGWLAVFGAFYRSGALVFGGGHVVLPMLRDALVVPGWVTPRTFMAGYGAAQAMPGPLFTVAAFLGSVSSVGPGGAQGAAIAIAAIFLPGLLLAAAVTPFWNILKNQRGAEAMIKGVNAAVVGLLGAAFVSLLSLSAIQSFWDGPIMLGALALLTWGKARPILVVIFCAAAGAVL